MSNIYKTNYEAAASNYVQFPTAENLAEGVRLRQLWVDNAYYVDPVAVTVVNEPVYIQSPEIPIFKGVEPVYIKPPEIQIFKDVEHVQNSFSGVPKPDETKINNSIFLVLVVAAIIYFSNKKQVL